LKVGLYIAIVLLTVTYVLVSFKKTNFFTARWYTEHDIATWGSKRYPKIQRVTFSNLGRTREG